MTKTYTDKPITKENAGAAPSGGDQGLSDKEPQALLQDYFDGLLFSTGAESTQVEASTPSVPAVSQEIQAPVAAPQRQYRPEPEPESLAVSEEALLAAKREQLQKLLTSARVQVTEASKLEVEAEVEAKVDTKVDAAPAVAELPVSVEAPVTEMLERALAADIDEDLADTIALTVLDEQLQWLENGRPRWAQQTFEVLLFKVSGLTLAVPLISLGQIQPLTDELTPLFGQADWFMGLQPTPSGKVRTVNTAKFVMPERYDAEFEKTAKYVISINGVPWGLAVDTVEQPISLSPEDVKWRSSRTQRPWLAGTVKEHMCALLDIPMVGKLLTDADKNAIKRQPPAAKA